MTETLKAVAQPVLFAPFALVFLVGALLVWPITLLVETASPPQGAARLAWLAIYWPLTALGAVGMALMAPLVLLMDERPDRAIRQGLDLLDRAVRYA